MGMKARSTATDPGRRFVENLYSHYAESAAPPTGKWLHLWGQFTEDLPAKFRPFVPGHQYLRCADLDEAAERTAELREVIFAQWPGAKEWAGKGWYRWMLPDGRQATLAYENKAPKRQPRRRS